jgi:hypothetical protein
MSKMRKYKVIQIYRNLDDKYEDKKLKYPRWLNTYEAHSTVRAIYEALMEFGDSLDLTFDLLITELVEEGHSARGAQKVDYEKRLSH